MCIQQIFIIYAVYYLGSEDKKIVTIPPLSNLTILYIIRKYKVLWEHIMGETNMVWLVKVTGEIISSRLEYLYPDISSMLETIFSVVRKRIMHLGRVKGFDVSTVSGFTYVINSKLSSALRTDGIGGSWERT